MVLPPGRKADAKNRHEVGIGCFDRVQVVERMKPIRKKKCRTCRELFTPFRPLQICCSAGCAIEKSQKDRVKSEQKEYREAKVKAKSRRDWLKEAQAAFNAFIRARDHAKPCVSCGRTHVEWTSGGAWDCGHYLGVGAYPELRFDEDNAAKQCKQCNGGSGRYAKKKRSTDDKYREELIRRIGLENVERLEGEHEPAKYTVEELKEIKQKYKKKTKEIILQM